MRSWFKSGACLLLLAAIGCGSSNIASVSGKVTVNGKPDKNAIVSFQPIGSKDNPEPGRGSAGVTDEQGRYSLTYDNEKPGAIVGAHRVRIFTKSGADTPEDLKAESIPGVKFFEPIPAEWHEESTKTFAVTAAGSTSADFEIWTKGAKK